MSGTFAILNYSNSSAVHQADNTAECCSHLSRSYFLWYCRYLSEVKITSYYLHRYSVFILGVQAAFNFTVSPTSKNVSAGTMVEFTCTMISKNGWTFYGVSSTILLSSYILSVSTLPKSGGIQETATLSFNALTEHNADTVACVAFNLNSRQMKYSTAALLMIQGNNYVNHYASVHIYIP